VVATNKSPIENKPVTIVSYELATRLAKQMPVKVLIADESHFLKSGDALRTKEIRTLATAAQHVVFISGTPALSRPIELFAQLQMLAPKVFTNNIVFGKRYCNGHQNAFGWDFNGSSNLDELHIVLSKTVLIRRLKKDCLTVRWVIMLPVVL
jgi:SWI/SNF-related matrix-associated actin-dependent regulator 1 of chromatin subfamily A